MNDIRNKVLLQLENNFTVEQLQMIDLAVAKSMCGYKIEPEETLPAVINEQIPADIKEFIVRKELRGCSDETTKLYLHVLMKFFYVVRKDLRGVKDVDILSFLDRRIHVDGVSLATAEANRLVLSSFFTFMHETGKISCNPSRTVDPIKREATVRTPLDDMELERVRNACRTPREKAMLEVLYSTGARVSEVAKLNIADIDVKNRYAIVLGKGKKERYIYFNAKALIAIDEYLKTRTDNTPALFVRSRAPFDRLGKGTIEADIKRIGERAGIGRNIFPHLLRHTFATDMLYRGAELDEVSELLGHAKLETTKIYAKTSNEKMKLTHRRYAA